MGVIADILAAHDAGFLDGEEAREAISELAEAYTRRAIADACIASELAFGPMDDEDCPECRREEAEASGLDTLH